MATRKDHRYAVSFFSIKLDEPIEGIPEEIELYSNRVTTLRPGDKVTVIGKIVIQELEHFPESKIQLIAEHLYNETLKCAY